MNCCDYNCHQGRDCPVRAQHYKPEKEVSMAKKIGQWALIAALVVFYAYMFAGTV